MSEKKGLKLLSMANEMKVSDMSESIIEGIKDGTINSVLMGVVLKKFAKLQEEVNKDKDAKDIIFKETSKYQEGNKKTISLYGAKITIGSIHTWWEYFECQDPLWDALDSIEKEIKLFKKQREEELQATVPKVNQIFGIPTKSMIIEQLPKLKWEESGEIVQIIPPVKKSTDGLKYSV